MSFIDENAEKFLRIFCIIIILNSMIDNRAAGKESRGAFRGAHEKSKVALRPTSCWQSNLREHVDH